MLYVRLSRPREEKFDSASPEPLRSFKRDTGALGLVQANIYSQLAIATLSVTFAGAYLSTRGGKAEEVTQPPINAKSKEEESFVKYGLLRSRSTIL